MESQIQQLVTEIIRRVTLRMGADGRQGRILVAIAAATVGGDVAVNQLRQMVLNGYQLDLAFSRNGRTLHGQWIDEQLAGFPLVAEIESDQWLGALAAARAVVVPLLSLNTASKASLLIADTLPTNLILHGLANAKPVIVAANGAHPEERHWAAKRKGNEVAPGLRRAALQRLDTLQQLGCRVVDVSQLNSALKAALEETQTTPNQISYDEAPSTQDKDVWQVPARTVTAGHISHAQRRGLDIRLPQGAVVTPLARDMARQAQVALIRDPV